MIVKNAELETVCGITSKLPENVQIEVAFAGKSNVGKSSLINGLMNRKSLARTSSAPGKTQTINFYAVTGRRETKKEAQMISMENQLNDARLETVFNELARKHMKEIYKMRKAGDNDGLLELQDSLEAQARGIVAKEPALKFSREQIAAYTTVGGAPHLDGAYTVFGEVTEGMDVIDKIQAVKTNRADRPETDVRILKATVIE